jgi:hypothetical protein
MGSRHPGIRSESFDPDMTEAMRAALDSAWQQLSVGHVETMPYRVKAARECMATAILDHAREGVSDPQLLVAAAMTALFSPRLPSGTQSKPVRDRQP